MSETCPICQQPMSVQYFPEAPVPSKGLLSYEKRCNAGCEKYSESYALGDMEWKVGHHHFVVQPWRDANTFKRICRLVLRARMLERKKHREES